MNLIEKLEDLYKQATERSHVYTASVLKETIEYLKAIDRDKISGIKEFEAQGVLANIELDVVKLRKILRSY